MKNWKNWKAISGLALLILVLVLATLTSGCANYADEMQKALKRIYKRDFRGYTFRGTPVGNFGVGTMYMNDIENPKVPIEERWLIGHPDTWFPDTLPKEEREALLAKIFVRGPLGSVSLQEDISRKLGLDLTIPVLREILSLGAAFNLEKGVQVTLKASEATNRRMNWTEFEIALRDGKIKPEIKSHVERRDFVLAANDIVLHGYKAAVTIDVKVNPELDAKLTEAVGKVLGKDTQLKVKFTSGTKGTYEVEAVHPVVAAILFKTPPQVAPLAGTDPEDWPTVAIDNRVLKPLEELLSRK